MKLINPQWMAQAKNNFNDSLFYGLISMSLVDLNQGRARVEIELAEKHLQPFGLVHGGVAATLIDTTGFWALYSGLPQDAGLTTVEIKINYLAPVKKGRLIAQGETIRLGKSLGLAQAKVEDENGNMVAHGTVTCMVIPDLEHQGQADMPPKFLP